MCGAVLGEIMAGGGFAAAVAVFAGITLMIPAAKAQSDSVAASGDGPACELHVWAATGIKGYSGGIPASLGYGGLLGALVAVSIAERDRHSSPDTDALSRDSQFELIERVPLAMRVESRAMRVVRHDDAIPRMEVTGVKTRHSDSMAACYSELILSQLYYDRAPMGGPELRSLTVYRIFDDSSEAKWSFSTWTATPVPAMTARQPGAAAVEHDFAAAFVANLEKFAGFARAARDDPPRSRKRH